MVNPSYGLNQNANDAPSCKNGETRSPGDHYESLRIALDHRFLAIWLVHTPMIDFYEFIARRQRMTLLDPATMLAKLGRLRLDCPVEQPARAIGAGLTAR